MGELLRHPGLVRRSAHRQREYQPVFEDWLWHTILPVLAYFTLLVAGAALEASSAGALLVIGAASLLLVFIGIHSAWDTVTHVTLSRGTREQGRRTPARPKPALQRLASHSSASTR